jgi:hypothetical protein
MAPYHIQTIAHRIDRLEKSHREIRELLGKGGGVGVWGEFAVINRNHLPPRLVGLQSGTLCLDHLLISFPPPPSIITELYEYYLHENMLNFRISEGPHKGERERVAGHFSVLKSS